MPWAKREDTLSRRTGERRSPVKEYPSSWNWLIRKPYLANWIGLVDMDIWQGRSEKNIMYACQVPSSINIASTVAHTGYHQETPGFEYRVAT